MEVGRLRPEGIRCNLRGIFDMDAQRR
jgi:hypothetical protein